MDTKQTKPENHVRVGVNSLVGSIVRYVNLLLQQKKYNEYEFSAIGSAVGKLVSAVELLKVVNPGLFQVNRISTISYDTKDTNGKVINQRLYPKLEVTLSLSEPKERGEGYQAKLNETERVKLFDLLNNRPQRFSRDTRDGRGRGRGGRGFGGRGGRGFGRGGRPPMRSFGRGQRSFRGRGRDEGYGQRDRDEGFGQRGRFQGSRRTFRGGQRGGYRRRF